MLFSLSSVAFIFLESVKHNKNPDTASPEAISGQVQVFTFPHGMKDATQSILLYYFHILKFHICIFHLTKQPFFTLLKRCGKIQLH